MLTRTAGALAAMALLGTVSRAPAVADEGVTLRLDAPKTHVMYSADEGAKGTDDTFFVPVGVDGHGASAHHITVRIDAFGLSGLARLEDRDCTGRGWIYTCAFGSPNDGESMTPFAISGVDGVEPGDGGTIRYTVTADNAPTVTGSTRMLVGGPLLTGRQNPAAERTGVAGTARLVPAFANHSRFTAQDGVHLKVTATNGLTLPHRYRNCRYGKTPGDTAWCDFPGPVKPGTAFETRDAFTFRAARSLIDGLLSYEVSSAPMRAEGRTVQGEGPPLALERVPDHGFDQRFPGLPVNVEVHTAQQANLRPVTATVKGRVGDTVVVRLGVENKGPGDPGDHQGTFAVTPPPGTTITSIPYEYDDEPLWVCSRPRKPAKEYVCDLGSDSFRSLVPGRSTTVGFHIRIDKRIPGAQGTITTHGPRDHTHDDDTAAILVDAAPARPHTARNVTWAVIGGVVLAGAAALFAARGVLRRRRPHGP